MEIYVCVTKKDNHNLNPSQKELIQWHFRLGHIWFQHVQLLIFTGRPKVQSNYKAVYNCERPKCAAYEFGKGYCQSNKVNSIQVSYNTQRASHIHLRCSQADVNLLTMPVVMRSSITKWL